MAALPPLPFRLHRPGVDFMKLPVSAENFSDKFLTSDF
jgi:hypothetical protein